MVVCNGVVQSVEYRLNK